MPGPIVLVTYQPDESARQLFDDILGDIAEVVYWPEVTEHERLNTLRSSQVVLSFDFGADLGNRLLPHLENCRFVQCLTAGVDFLPFNALPPGIPVACNAGAYAESMAEHVLAMALSAAKRLSGEHASMKAGEFNQFRPTRRLAGLTCGILGYGETGREVGRIMRLLDVRIQAVNRTGHTTDPVEFIGRLEDLDRVLAAADILVVTVSLTRKTRDMIGPRHLALMKKNAILVNVARGEIVQQTALYDHLVANPEFTACLEAWWVEPIRHGRFAIEHPFLDLPNVIASPHNSAMSNGTIDGVLRRGSENVRRFLEGQEPRFLVGEEERLA